MAALNTLRNRGGAILSIVIGIALLAFLLGDFAGNGSGAMNSNITVGEINGQEISSQQFQNQVDHMTQIQQIMSGSESNTPEEYESIRQQAWEQLVNDYAFDPGFEKLGITVSAEEQLDMVYGQYVSPIIQNLFVNRETGMFDKTMLKNYVASLDMDESGKARYFWNYIENQIVQERVMSKFLSIVQAGIFVTDLEIAQGVSNSDNLYNADYIALSYKDTPDSTIKVTNAELKKYYDAHKEMFKQVASRDLEYVVFDVLPSEQDYAEAEKYITQIASEFAQTPNVQQYVSLNSQSSFNPNYFKESELSGDVANFAFGASKDAMYGPVLNGDTYTLARINDIKVMPDTMGAKQILIAKDQAQKADSIIGALKKGADFAELAAKYSGSPDAQKGGDLGRFSYNQLSPDMSAPIFNAKNGEIIKVESQYGIHVIAITYRGAEYKKAQLGVISYKIEPSSATQQAIYGNASKFLAGAQDGIEEFNNSVIENALSKHVARVKSTDRAVTGLEESKELVRWAFGDNKTPISAIMEINGDYIVAAVTASREDGYASFEQVKSEITPLVRREMLGKMLAEKMTGFSSLYDAAAKLSADTAQIVALDFNSFHIPGVGYEPMLIGAICSGSEIGKLSKPVIGNTGVFLFNVTAKEVKPEVTAESESVKLNANSASYLSERTLNALYGVSNIKDSRVKYF